MLPPQASAVDWFRRSKFGVFVHFGSYAVLGRGEQVLVRELIPLDEYESLADAFCPEPDWAIRLVEAIAAAGARYAVLTARHHDGFCLFPTRTHDYHAAARGAKRDLVEEFVTAARGVGLRVGLYQSVHTWRWRGYWDPAGYPDDLPRMVEELHAQVGELMTSYGPIDVLWYDGPQAPGSAVPGDFNWAGAPIGQDKGVFWRIDELNARVREWQPEILINDRGGVAGDFGTPEQTVKPAEQGRLWETCMTLNQPPGWGCLAAPSVRKPAPMVLWHLIDAVRRGGNFLFNVGPDASGGLPQRDRDTLAELGRWLERNGEAVYGTSPGDIYRLDQSQGIAFHYGMFTQRRECLYLVLFYPPSDGVVTLARLAGELQGASVLGDGTALDVDRGRNGRWLIRGVARTGPGEMPGVLKLTFAEPPVAASTRDAGWLDGNYRPETNPGRAV